jgi:NADH-quinone oxidoreductase subunit N
VTNQRRLSRHRKPVSRRFLVVPIDLVLVQHLLPELLLVTFAVCVFLGGTWNRTQLGWSTLAVVAFGFGALMLFQQPAGESVADGSWEPIIADALAQGLRMVALLLGALFSVFSTQSRQQKLYPELLGSLVLMFVGLMLVCSAGDLVLLFVGLELISIPTYVLLFIARDGRDSDEATAKYFFLSILSSAMMLYGFASLYGLAGDVNLGMIQASLQGPEPPPFPLFYPVAVGLIVLGFCFRMAAVPFHFYAPDVYQATTNLNAALLAVVPKIAGVVGLVRVLVVAVPHETGFAWMLILALSVLTMTLGNVVALWQTNLRRLLAYSSIAHAGYLLIGLAAALGVAPGASPGRDAVAAMLFYVFVYALATLAAFAGLAYLSDDDESYSTLSQLGGAGRHYPVIGGALAVSMFSLMGIPPLAGFWGKFALFRSALDAGLSGDGPMDRWYVALCVIGVLNAAIAAGYYLRVVAALYFQPAEEAMECEPVLGNAGAGLVALIAGALVIGVGLFTGPTMTRARTAADGLNLNRTDPSRAIVVPATALPRAPKGVPAVSAVGSSRQRRVPDRALTTLRP